MANYGLLINYGWCTGCRSCEVACKEEHHLSTGKWGIRLYDDGPWAKGDSESMGKDFNWNRITVPTDLCDLCAERVSSGIEPTCVHHCLASCMKFGTIDELCEELKKEPKQVLFVPTAQ